MSIMYVKKEGFTIVPDVQLEWGEGKVNMYAGKEDIGSKNFPRILMFCPHCGTEQVIYWEHYGVSLYKNCTGQSFSFLRSEEGKKREKADSEAMEHVKKEIEDKYSFTTIIKKIFNEIIEYSDRKTCKCVCCGESINLSPGYYLNDCKEFIYRLKDAVGHDIYYDELYKVKQEYFYEYGFYKKYENMELIKPYISSNKYAKEAEKENKDYIYSYNEISREFINGLKKKNKEAEDIRISCCFVGDKGDNAKRVSLSYDEAFDMMREYRKVLFSSVREKRLNDFVKKAEKDSKNRFVDESELESLNDSDLRKYLRNIIQIEANILALKQRLPILYFINEDCGNISKRIYNCSIEEIELNDAENYLKSIREEMMKYRDNEDYWEEFYDSFLDIKDRVTDDLIRQIREPKEPLKPIIHEPGFFNKKKVQEENEKKIAEYNQSYEEYKDAKKEYDERIASLKEKKHKQEQDAERQAKEKVLNIINDLEVKEKAALEDVEKAKQSLEHKKQMLSEMAIEESVWEKEIKEAEETLRKYIDVKYEYESHNVVFPKYRNFVAYSSFYEYIESGRCDTLSGKDGAYNLYETEMRQNLVIAQLSSVLESLEEIKDNQYMIYSKVTEINEGIDLLNDSMNNAVSTLKRIEVVGADINDTLKRVEENTDVIAYNTERAAYYSKMNTQLTNALGFMMALK